MRGGDEFRRYDARHRHSLAVKPKAASVRAIVTALPHVLELVVPLADMHEEIQSGVLSFLTVLVRPIHNGDDVCCLYTLAWLCVFRQCLWPGRATEGFDPPLTPICVCRWSAWRKTNERR